VDEYEWTVFENTHESVISQDTYDTAPYQHRSRFNADCRYAAGNRCFVGRYVPPHFEEMNLTPEEQEERRKIAERKDRLTATIFAAGIAESKRNTRAKPRQRKKRK